MIVLKIDEEAKYRIVSIVEAFGVITANISSCSAIVFVPAKVISKHGKELFSANE
jgi:hypothetical protein